MSHYKPKTGEVVRVIIEGPVSWSGDHSFEMEYGSVAVRYGSKHVVSIEKVAPPLPTTPNSIVREKSDPLNVRVLHDDGRWYGTWIANPLHSTDPRLCDYEVIFDAGKVSA